MMWGHRCAAVGRFAYSRASRAADYRMGPLFPFETVRTSIPHTDDASVIPRCCPLDEQLLVNNDPHSYVVHAESSDCERVEHLVESVHVL